MRCEKCQQRQAQVHVSQKINEKTVQQHLCEVCALELKEQSSPFAFSVHDFLGHLYDESTHAQTGPQNASSKQCVGCGQTYSDYKRTGLFGCPECYRSFRLVVIPLIKRIHGDIHHAGKIPLKVERIQRFEKKKKQLQNTLQEAVREEAYEKAAETRDQIQLLEKKITRLREGSL